MPPAMGQPITVVEKPSSTPGVARFETNRSLTGMGHERYRVGRRHPRRPARRRAGPPPVRQRRRHRRPRQRQHGHRAPRRAGGRARSCSTSSAGSTSTTRPPATAPRHRAPRLLTSHPTARRPATRAFAFTPGPQRACWWCRSPTTSVGRGSEDECKGLAGRPRPSGRGRRAGEARRRRPPHAAHAAAGARGGGARPPRRRVGRGVHRVAGPPRHHPGAGQGGHPLPPRPRRRRGQGPGRHDDVQDRPGRPALRRRQGRRAVRPQPAVADRARAGHAPVHLRDQPHPRAPRTTSPPPTSTPTAG